jgi:hypothetical protein
MVDAISGTGAVLTMLSEPTRLYNLSRTTLEHLVGDVVREDGFVKLVRCLTQG